MDAPDSVDAYIAAQTPPIAAVCHAVRAALRKALPEATETISYKIPTYKIGGRTILHFAAWKKHYALYPVHADLVATFGDELARCEIAGTTLRFSYDDPIPAGLIARIALFLAKRPQTG